MVGVLNGRGRKAQTAKVGTGFSEKDQERIGNRVMAGNLKFNKQEQVEMINTLLAELSPEVLHVAANALEAKEQFVIVLNARQCHECGKLNLPENVVNGKCGKCQ